MSKRSFVLHRMDSEEFQFESPFITRERIINNYDNDKHDSTFTRIELKNTDISKFKIADLKHRFRVKANGLWHGSFVNDIVQERQFHSYYSRKEQLFVSNIEKYIANDAVRNLNKAIDENIPFKKIKVDMHQLIKLSTNIIQIWFGINKDENLRQVALFGNHIDNSRYYKENIQTQVVKSMAIEINFNNKVIGIHISKDGSLYFSDDYDLAFYLNFILFLRKKVII